MREARALALYLAALGPAAAARLAWPVSDEPPRLWAVCLALALATALGEAFAPGSRALGERGGRRAQLWLLTFAAGLVFLIVAFAAAAPRPALLARQVLALLALQGGFLLLPSLGPGRLPALATSLALAVLAGLRGGELASIAIAVHVAGLAPFLVLDHFTRRLAQQPQAASALAPIALLEAARLGCAGLLALLGAFAIVPPSPHVGLEAATLDSLASRQELAAAYLQLALFSMVGASIVYYVSRLLRQRKPTRGPVTENVEAERGAEELLPERPTRDAIRYDGRRGGVVRAYVRFLSAAAESLLRRRPEQTPAEIAAELAAAGPALPRLTALFQDARYGPGEPGDDAVAEAEALSQGLLAWLESRPESAPSSEGAWRRPA